MSHCFNVHSKNLRMLTIHLMAENQQKFCNIALHWLNPNATVIMGPLHEIPKDEISPNHKLINLQLIDNK